MSDPTPYPRLPTINCIEPRLDPPVARACSKLSQPCTSPPLAHSSCCNSQAVSSVVTHPRDLALILIARHIFLALNEAFLVCNLLKNRVQLASAGMKV